MKKFSHSWFSTCLVGLALTAFSVPVQAYKQADIIKLNTPNDTPVKMLLGYNSKTGMLMEQCLKPVKSKQKPGVDPTGEAKFKYVRSMQDILNEHSLDVSAKVSLQFGVAGGSASADYSQFNRNRNKVDQGMMYGTYIDLVKPWFANPNAKFEFNDFGAEQYRKSIRRSGTQDKFEKECGDAVIIGTQKARFMQLYGWYKNTSSLNEQQREVGVKAAVNYLRSSASVEINVSDYNQEVRDSKNLVIEYYPSGNAIQKGAGDLASLKNVFETFPNLPLSQTTTTLYMYIVPYKDLLPPDQFDLGLSRAQLRRVNTIVDGALALSHARNEISAKARMEKDKNKKAKLVNARSAMNRELTHLGIQMKRNKGCMRNESRSCKNMEKRFSNFVSSANRQKMRQFINRRIQSTHNACAQGYPITSPVGQAMCQQCPLGKRPVFLNRQEGTCRYLAKEQKPSGVERVWAHQLKTSRKVQQEAGVTVSVAEYPNTCNKNERICGKSMATKLCKAKGLGKAQAYQVWHPGGYRLSSAVPRTIYPDGSRCKPKHDGFTAKRCRTFLYLDCASS